MTSVQTAAVTNINDVPVGLPTITGTVTEDQILTADTSGISDADGLGAFSYQWLRNGVAIGGATASTYTLGDADVGTQISVRVDYTDTHTTAESVTSVQTAAVTNINDVPVGLPTITGTVTEDQILTADTSGISDADGLGAFSYQWLRDGVAIGGATASTYTLGDADVGTQISVRVDYTDTHTTAESVTSVQTAAVVNINDAPVGLPTITGTVTEDQILTADTSGISDADGLGAFSYQWLRDGVAIGGATASTYTLGDADVGTQISVRVDYTDTHTTAESVTSVQTAAVANINDVPVGLPTITGTVTEDQILTADTSGISDADGLGAFSYQWLRDGVAIGGATASTYTLGDADVGTQISVRVDYTDTHTTAESVTSVQTAAVTNINDAPVGLPTITGTVTEDQILTADTSGISDADGLGAFSYQWLRNGVAIGGATASTYTLGDADVGTQISVRVDYTDTHTTAESVTSVQTAAVTNINDVPVGLPTITGTVTEDQILTADTAGISDADGLGAFSYQWLRDGVAIGGATASTYTLGDADVGTQISVRVDYTDGESTAESVTSAQTVAVSNVNDAPVSVNDAVVINEGDSVIIDVAANDTDVDSVLDLNSIIITTAPANGSLVINGDGTVTYTHNGSETVSDSFNYTISDIEGAVSNIATVSLVINPVNDAPVAQDDNALSVNEGATAVFDLAFNDTDSDDGLDLNSITITSASSNGSLVVNGDGTVTYTHDGSETLSDSFTYTIADISGAISNFATANIVINPVNDAPTTVGITNVTVLEDSVNTSVDLNAAFNDTDNSDSELSYSIVGNTNIGLFSSTNIDVGTGQLSLDYAADNNGSSQITVRATDLAGASVDTLLTVNVTPVNDVSVVDANTGVLISDVSEKVIDTSMLNAFDIDNALSEIRYIVTDLPNNGTLLLNGVEMTINDSFTQADLVSGNISYQVGINPSTNDQFSFTVTDGSSTSSAMNFNIVIGLTPVEAEEPIVPTTDPVDVEPVVTESIVPIQAVSSPKVSLGLGVERAFNNAVVHIEKELTPSISLQNSEETETLVEESLVDREVTSYDLNTATSFEDIKMKSIKALWQAIDQMRENIDSNITENMTEAELKAAVISSSGVALTAGVVAWALRSGALMTSLISTIPLWKGYDPMPILAKSNDDEDEVDSMSEDMIPTSLGDVKKLKALNEKTKKDNQVDKMFSGVEARE